jgi:hypothetical protein
MVTGPVLQSVFFMDPRCNSHKKVNHGAILLSIMKMDCENYLFEDYHWKSGIAIWNLDLMPSGTSHYLRYALRWATTLFL